MKGIICLWSGAVVDIPEGWHLCDGTEETPDLRDRFIVGAGSTYAPDDSGGSSSHNHNAVAAGAHVHTLAVGTYIANSSPSGAKSVATMTSGNHTHTIENSLHLPPYYALCYIMKL